ncbi:MAG: hypothetical protein EXR39_12415 [Betaproteobacteria bacterium]|nr:hypothetical protein [Betaproteobacteria bacterium]
MESMRCSLENSIRPATLMAMARTRRQPPVATLTFRPRAPRRYSERSAAWRRARIAAYKVCWGPGNCHTSDIMAAIDQAVADGVDVINYSISGTQTNFQDPVEQAFMRAAAAGVFVAAAAGNNGPNYFTVTHPSPWITTVAAGTHNRSSNGSVTLGNDSTYVGASISQALPSKPLIDANAARLPLVDENHANACLTKEIYEEFYRGTGPVLDPALVAGKIVVCEFGGNSRVDKSLAMQRAGGVGMILLNNGPGQTLNTELHFVPTVQLSVSDRVAVTAYAATAGATAAISQGVMNLTTPAPFTANFSSRGPSQAAGGNLLKPDIIAPGQDILAGVSPVGYKGRLFDVLSGTSMSSPHIAGIAALMKELHPKWSPMAIKSALMTSAGDVLDGPNTAPKVIRSQGAGHVRPNNAANPGLVFDSGPIDWQGFLCGIGAVLPATCTAANVPVLHASDLNVPSIAIGFGKFATKQTVTRRVTNKSSRTTTYTASYDMPGFTVTVSPPSLTMASGQTKSFTVTFAPNTATPNYYGGQLTWTGGTSASDQRTVRIPMLVYAP